MDRVVRKRIRQRGLCAVAFVLLYTSAVYAQSITDARRVEFSPSVDHSAIVNGVAVVQSYSMQIFVSGGTQPVQTINLGKPALDVDGKIRLDFVALLTTPLTTGVVYEARISAIGPGGTGTSLPSNTFSFTAPCAPTISPSTLSAASGGG